MAQFFKSKGVKWRPHIKGIKIPEIAKMLISSGAIGITCAKLSEAEVMINNGIKNILIANQIVGGIKIYKLISILDKANVIVAVDNEINVKKLSEASKKNEKILNVIIEVDTGMGRAGVEPGEESLKLAKYINSLPGIKLIGLMAWEAHCLGLPKEERQLCCENSVLKLVEIADLCRKSNIDIEIISCGGSGTFQYTSCVPGVTEIQAGGAIFNDLLYKSWGINYPFALTLISTVTSRPTKKRIIVDSGRKSLSVDISEPLPLNIKSIDSILLGAEHGIIKLNKSNKNIKVGDKIEWLLGYGDFTVCLHDEMIGIRNGNVEVIWKILARGKLK